MNRLELVSRVIIDENGKVDTTLDIEDAKGVEIDLLSLIMRTVKQNEAKYQKVVDSYLKNLAIDDAAAETPDTEEEPAGAAVDNEPSIEQ